GAGAAGGAGAALLALGAVRQPGASVVAAAAGLAGAVATADLVLTGEGAFDWDSLRGRVVGAVCDSAARLGVPVVVVAGQVLVGRRELAAVGVEAAYPVAATARDLPGVLADPAGTLAARTERVARTWHR
ncbi:glycerate kinase, partial [Aquipuribacter sp. SD81]|uniref:glycerate kinase n=1 Tax=Aquipuribacter sp. SD81 TaxID=3127703 RepID=UPI00301AB315